MLWRVAKPAHKRRPLPSSFIEPCLPTLATAAPAGPLWLHEIKHDGARLISRKEGQKARLWTRRGNDWTERFPAVAASLSTVEAHSATIDGEVVVLDDNGVADFAKLRSSFSGRTAHNAILYAFDLMELNGIDLRREPLEQRRARLRQIVGDDGAMRFNASVPEDFDGPTIFRHACAMGLEGIVSKLRTAPYQSGRCSTWLKVRNPDAPAVRRVQSASEP